MRWLVSSERCCSPAILRPAMWPALPHPDLPARAWPDMSRPTEPKPAVDVELVLAVDVSYSMDMDELAIQREGYAQAIVSKEFLQALKSGPNGKIAVTYFEWAAASDQKIIIPWRLIDGPETADAVANEIMKTPIRRASRTSISGAIYFAMPLFDEDPYHGLRRVIEFPATVPTKRPSPVIGARDEAVSKGIVINGLPIMVKEPSYSTMDIDNLDYYYEDCVIGGPGSFVVTIKDREKFKEAIRTKLLLEVAGRTPDRPVVPRRRQGAAGVPCMIGEKIWQDRWEGRPARFHLSKLVMPGLVAGHHVFWRGKDVDARHIGERKRRRPSDGYGPP